MRVTNQSTYDAIRYRFEKTMDDLVKANEIISSGKRINKLSDDPIGLVQALGLRQSLSSIKQLGRNITYGKSWMTAAESALGQIQDLLSNAQNLGVQMASATVGPSERASAANNVQVIFDQMVSLANTDMNGHHIFAGSKTESAPFQDDGTYVGDDNPFTIKIGRKTTLEIGNDGEAVFGTVFNTLKELKNSLSNNDVSGIREALGKLDSQFDHIGAKISEIGSKMVRMETREKIFKDLELADTKRLSAIEDTDIAEATISLKEKELAYQATLASSSEIMKRSLVDYL